MRAAGKLKQLLKATFYEKYRFFVNLMIPQANLDHNYL